MVEPSALDPPGSWMPPARPMTGGAAEAGSGSHSNNDHSIDPQGGASTSATPAGPSPPASRAGQPQDEGSPEAGATDGGVRPLSGEANGDKCTPHAQQAVAAVAAPAGRAPSPFGAAGLPPLPPVGRAPSPPGGWLSLHVPTHLWPEFFFRCVRGGHLGLNI